MDEWVCIELEEESLERLKERGDVLGYCRVLIERRSQYDHVRDDYRYYLEIKTSIGRFGGFHDDYSEFSRAMRDKGWVQYQRRPAYDWITDRHVFGLFRGSPDWREEMWVRSIPNEPIGEEEIRKLDSQGVDIEYYGLVIRPDPGRQLVFDVMSGPAEEGKGSSFEVWGSDGTYEVREGLEELKGPIDALKTLGWRWHKTESVRFAEVPIVLGGLSFIPVPRLSEATMDELVGVLTYARFEPPVRWDREHALRPLRS